MVYKAVLFDLDGTLLNTLRDLSDAVNRGLKLLGFPQHPMEEYKYFIGEGREIMATLALPEDKRDSSTISRLVDYINEYYTQHWADHTRPYPGIPELLDALTADRIKLSVLSNKPHDFTQSNVLGLLSRWHFDIVLGSSPATPQKPDCTAALRIAQELEFSPSEFIYLGDSGIDMQTAVNAGMFPVGALWGFRTAEELRSCGARELINCPTDLLKLIK